MAHLYLPNVSYRLASMIGNIWSNGVNRDKQ